jgi:isochorismate hydrolase
MHKEEYLTIHNLKEKTNSWHEQLKEFQHRWKTFLPQDSALLIIDMQNYFLQKSSHAYVPSSPVILAQIKKLVTFYEKSNLSVIFTYTTQQKGNPLQKWWKNIIPLGGTKIPLNTTNHKVIEKSTYDAFHNTNLLQILQSHKIKQLVITGVLTNLCCENTARTAFNYDYDVFFPTDATGTYNEHTHISSLRTLAYGFATPLTTDKIIKTSVTK